MTNTVDHTNSSYVGRCFRHLKRGTRYVVLHDRAEVWRLLLLRGDQDLDQTEVVVCQENNKDVVIYRRDDSSRPNTEVYQQVAYFQTATPLVDMFYLGFVYRDLDSGRLSVRRKTEFLDGRFQEIFSTEA